MRALTVAILAAACSRTPFAWPEPVVPGGDAGALGAPMAWQRVTPASLPPPLRAAKLIYFPPRGTILMYGGVNGTTSSDALWEYDGATWTQLCAACPPGPRRFHGFVFDEARDVAVLFGGEAAAGSANDLWELDADLTWTERTPSGTPPPAWEAAWVGYREGRVVVFGGADTDRVYEFDGAAWHGPLGVSAPPFRSPTYPCATTDHRGRLLLYGGHDLVAYRDDMWAWDGVAWEEVCSECTGIGRESATLVLDPRRRVIILVTGFIGVDPEMSGTWEGVDSFTVVDPDTPDGRDNVGLAYDPVRDVVVGYGGNGSSCPGDGDCDETFEYRRVEP